MADSALGHAVVLRSGMATTTTTAKDKIVVSSSTTISSSGVRLPLVSPEEMTSSSSTTLMKAVSAGSSTLIGYNNNKTTSKADVISVVNADHEDDDETDTKRRRTDRFDSSESSDSGVASLTCSDASPWSSGSDITDPMSPDSPVSSSSSCQPSPAEGSAAGVVGERLAESESACVMNGPPSLEMMTITATCLASNVNRRRRHSDSSARETSVRAKRVRRCSGDSAQEALPTNFKWLSHLWKNNGGSAKNVLDLPVCHRKQPMSWVQLRHQRQSWPLISRRTQTAASIRNKSAQLRITEFFSAQVKNNWTYSKFSTGLKELKEKMVPTEPRVSIVSVAHVDTALVAPEPLQSAIATSPLSVSPLCGIKPSPETSTAPQQIRFPVDRPLSNNKTETTSPSSPDASQCLWKDCTATLTPGQSLLEHMQTTHVAPQAASSSSSTSSSLSSTSSKPVGASSSNHSLDSPAEVGEDSTELYACQWEGCKVQGRKSSSRAWLERHVLLHAGYKPFRCIVESCGQRFNSQVALERHINAHFNQEAGQQCNGGQHGLKRDHLSGKAIRRNSKKLKNRLIKAAPARLCDYFDAGIMERLRHQLLCSHASQNRLGFSLPDRTLTVRSQVIARRMDSDGSLRVLLRWTPTDVLPDQWVKEDQVTNCKTVPLHSLSPAVQIRLYNEINGSGCPATGAARPKQRRK